MKISAKHLRSIIREEVVRLISEDRQFDDAQKKANELARALNDTIELLWKGGKTDSGEDRLALAGEKLEALRDELNAHSAVLGLTTELGNVVPDAIIALRGKGPDAALKMLKMSAGPPGSSGITLDQALRLISGERVDDPQAHRTTREAVPPGQERPEYVPGPSQGFIGGMVVGRTL